MNRIEQVRDCLPLGYIFSPKYVAVVSSAKRTKDGTYWFPNGYDQFWKDLEASFKPGQLAIVVAVGAEYLETIVKVRGLRIEVVSGQTHFWNVVFPIVPIGDEHD